LANQHISPERSEREAACSRWQANQFRLFLHMGAYWLLHSLRLAAPKRSRWRGATFATIRSVFVKIAVRVEELKRSIKLAFPRHLPHADALAPVSGHLTRKARDRRGRCRPSSVPSSPNACQSVPPPTSRQPGRCRAPAPIGFTARDYG
jgi:Transposase DDE domain group 1